MDIDSGKITSSPLYGHGNVKRRGLLKLGTWTSGIFGALALSGLNSREAEGAPPSSEKDLSATFAPRWKASTPYVAGDLVISPSGDLVKAKAAFTSGVAYSARDWVSASLASLLFLSVQEFDGKSDGSINTGAGTDNVAALNQTIARARITGQMVYLPAGVYATSGEVDFRGVRVCGAGVSKTVIMCTDTTKAVAIVGGGGAHLSDMTIQHFAIPDSTAVAVPNGVGLRVQKLGDRSVLERLHIRNVTSGIYSYEPYGDSTNYIYSTRFADIRVERFNHSAGYFRGYRAGNTGCIFENLYAQNGNGDGTYVAAPYGWFFGEFDECEVTQANVEWGYYGTGVTINGCQSFRIFNTHFEQYRAKGSSFSAYFNIVGAATRNVTISGVTYKNCYYDIAHIPDYALVRIQDANSVLYENSVSSGATVSGNPNLVKYRFAPAVEGANVIPRNVRHLDGSFGTETYYQSALVTPGVRVLTTPLGSSMYEESGGMRWKTPNSTVITIGGNVTSVATNYTVLVSDLFVFASGGAQGITVTLPAASKGGCITIKKSDSGAGEVTIATASNETIDGHKSYSLTAPYDKIALVSDGTAWYIV